jgi:MFS family permease
MLRAVAAIATLLFAAAILLAGNGLQGTLLAVRASIEGFPLALIGVLMASYYAGFILGCRFNPGFIKSVGHIRTFVALASIASAATLMHALFVDVIAWGILRAISGFCFAGLIMIIESWINERATNSDRGRILAIYRIVDLSATMLGNAMLATANPAGFQLFAMTSILLSIALVPVALTRSAAPAPIETARLNIPRLVRTSPLAAIGAPLVGLGNAAFWAVGPVYAQKLGYDQSVIAAFMSVVIIGAAVSQWPLGWLSDRIDRRYVMLGSSLLGAAAALALARFGGQADYLLLGFGALFGAFVLPMFGLNAAHANDLADPGTAVETNGGLLLINASGSVVGAVAGGYVMSIFGPGAVFDYIAVVYFVFSAVCLMRIFSRAPVPEEEKAPFTPAPRLATPAMFEIAQDDRDQKEESAEAGASALSS